MEKVAKLGDTFKVCVKKKSFLPLYFPICLFFGLFGFRDFNFDQELHFFLFLVSRLKEKRELLDSNIGRERKSRLASI